MRGIRGNFLHFIQDPFYFSENQSYQYYQDGLLVMDEGKIVALDSFSKLQSTFLNLPITHYPNSLILPGFVDTHIHYSQSEMIASYGEGLLEWLEKYAFPVEKKYRDEKYARQIAAVFLQLLLKNGTTSALVFGTVHPGSVEVLFDEARELNMRLIAGKVLMDRKGFAPDDLCDSPEQGEFESRALIEKWHGVGRLSYAITPRFAITSSPEQLLSAGKLKREYPDVYVHTHLSESVDEVKTVARLYPDSRDYVDVYDRAGLLSSKSIFAHGIHLSPSELRRIHETHSSIAFCPSSNLFLGSGLFRLNQFKSKETPIQVGMGTDVGAGTSFSLLQTLNQAYKVTKLQGERLSAFQAFYLATLGGARALSLDRWIGNFETGKEADFVVLNLDSTPIQKFRILNLREKTGEGQLHESLFSLMMLGDDRAIVATYIYGKLRYQNPQLQPVSQVYPSESPSHSL